MIYKTLSRKPKIEQREPHLNWGELGCSGRVSSFCTLMLLLLQIRWYVMNEVTYNMLL